MSDHENGSSQASDDKISDEQTDSSNQDEELELTTNIITNSPNPLPLSPTSSENAEKIDVQTQSEIPAYERLSGTVPFEELYNSDARINDPQQDIVSFPDKDVITETFTKYHKTPYAVRPNAEYENQLDPYVKVCFEFFSADWTLVRNTHTGYKRMRFSTTVFDLGVPLYDGDDLRKFKELQPKKNTKPPPSPSFSSRQQHQTLRKRGHSSVAPMKEIQETNVAPNDPHFSYIKPYTKRIEARNKKDREKNRLELFEYFDPNYDWQPGTEVALCSRIRKTLRPDNKHEVKFKPFYFSVEPMGLVLQLGELEPFFCSLALYQIDQNTKEAKKISETYSFQKNSANILQLVADHWKQPNSPLETRKAMFSVSARTAHVYLVFEAFKVLQGDPEISIDPYSKISTVIKQKEQEKVKGRIKDEVKDYCARLGKYRQPFCWAAVQVFDPKGNLLLQESTKLESIYSRTTRDSISSLVQMLASGDLKKVGKDLHAICSLKVNKITNEEYNNLCIIDHSLQLINGEALQTDDTPSEQPTDGTSPTPQQQQTIYKEIYEFPQYQSFIPNFYYVNNMYIYPLFANLGNKNGRNITVRMEVKEDDIDMNSPPLKCICSPYSSIELIDNIYTTVHYHNKNPHFVEEFKLILPPKLSDKHHLLFTFYHIIVAKKKKVEETEVVVGYAVVPLFRNGRIVVHNMDTYHGVNIHSRLDPGYMNMINKAETPAVGKAPFALQFNLVSTIYPEDQSITEFLNIYHTSEEEVPDKVLVSVINNLQGLTELLAVQYLPVIINNLLEVMVTRSQHKPKLEAFKTLVIVLHKVKTKLAEPVPRNSLLELYTNYIFQQTFTTHHSVYETLCSNFLLYMMEKKLEETHEDSIFVNSWFIFDLVIKSMVLELEKKGKHNQAQKKGLFDDFYARTLSRLLVNLTKYFKAQMGTKLGGTDARILNKNLALFLKDLFSIFDRGIVLDMLRSYLRDMTDPTQELLSATYKFEFLRIIIDHEHFVPLNLIFHELPDLNLNTLTQRYPLAFTVTFETLEALKSTNPEVWSLGISVLYDIVVKNAYDERFSEASKRQRVADIYFLLIPAFLDSWSQFLHWQEHAPKPLKREFYICILYVLKSGSRELLCRWWRDEITRNHVLFLRLLYDILQTFEYSPELTRSTKTLLTPQVALFMKKIGTEEMTTLLKELSESKENPEEEDKRLRWLSVEVNTLILDVVEAFISDFRTDLTRALDSNPVMTAITELLCRFMSIKQCQAFVHLLYASLRGFVTKFAIVLFKGDNTYLIQLLQQILLHCNFPQDDIHIEASTLLFLLLKLNQRTSGNFGRTRMQTITTLSSLVQSKKIEKDIKLNVSFTRLAEYSLHLYSTLKTRDIDQSIEIEVDDEYAHNYFSNFTRSVQDMSISLMSILRDTLRVTELTQTADPQMIADLFYQIADSYKNTPDLRLHWLDKLALLQEAQGNFVESGIVYTHSSALIVDYLISSGKIHPKLVDVSIFHKISPQIKEFSHTEEEGVCQDSLFSEKGLLSDTRKAIRCFRSAEYYEFASQLYKFISPIYEKNQAYHELAQAHNQLHEMWTKVSLENEQRLFGKYFRVGFFGESFGEDLDNHEYVYKEPKLTHILELTERLKTFYAQKTGKEVIHIDAKHQTTEMDPTKCFLQITKIDPYIFPEETRKTFFEFNTNLSNFVFETPYTLSGKSHADDISGQFKKKTIITISGSFPSIVTRLPVIKKRDVIVTPIQNAIEDIIKRNNDIESAVNQKPINPKTLTQVLQGSALPQVNEGALAICRKFLPNYKDFPKENVLKLCDSLKEFLEDIRIGLGHNKRLITTDNDKKFHFEMETGFKQIEAEIQEYFSKIVYDTDNNDASLTEQDEENTASGDGSDSSTLPNSASADNLHAISSPRHKDRRVQTLRGNRIPSNTPSSSPKKRGLASSQMVGPTFPSPKESHGKDKDNHLTLKDNYSAPIPSSPGVQTPISSLSTNTFSAPLIKEPEQQPPPSSPAPSPVPSPVPSPATPPASESPTKTIGAGEAKPAALVHNDTPTPTAILSSLSKLPAHKKPPPPSGPPPSLVQGGALVPPAVSNVRSSSPIPLHASIPPPIASETITNAPIPHPIISAPIPPPIASDLQDFPTLPPPESE